MRLEKIGYTTPTPIQEKSIPLVLQGKDLFGCAQTGTGKTAAFALPILQNLTFNNNREGKISALILAPTRELALQISENITAIGADLNISHTTIYGGVSQFHQVKKLKEGVDILVATPGRLLDLMQQGYISLKHIQYFVLDEADKMLDMGFIRDIKKILTHLPAKKQTLFFSATASSEIMQLAEGILVNPEKVAVTPVSSTTELIEQSVYYVSRENKRMLLKHLLENNRTEYTLIFTRTKKGADRVSKELNKSGFKSDAIHGDKSQGARTRALKGFKDKQIQILVATDIASRGIDVDKLGLVINYELPEVAETYVHRIGRTGRAGATGKAFTLCANEELPYLKDINRLIKKNIPVVNTHPFN